MAEEKLDKYLTYDELARVNQCMKKRKKKRKKRDDDDDEPWWCDAWALAPFYGRGDGSSSPATFPPDQNPLSGPQTSPGIAYPGFGGINAPGVPSGPNSGMGPIVNSVSLSAKGLMEDVHAIACVGDKK